MLTCRAQLHKREMDHSADRAACPLQQKKQGRLVALPHVIPLTMASGSYRVVQHYPLHHRHVTCSSIAIPLGVVSILRAISDRRMPLASSMSGACVLYLVSCHVSEVRRSLFSRRSLFGSEIYCVRWCVVISLSQVRRGLPRYEVASPSPMSQALVTMWERCQFHVRLCHGLD